MPPKYESADTTKLTSDLVILDHDTSDNENEGGGAKPNGDANGHANGANGNGSGQTKDEVGVGQCLCVRACAFVRESEFVCGRRVCVYPTTSLPLPHTSTHIHSYTLKHTRTLTQSHRQHTQQSPVCAHAHTTHT